MDNRPRQREKFVSSESSGVHKRGEGLGTGRVGQRPSQSSPSSFGKRAAATGGGGAALLGIIGFILVRLLGGGGDSTDMLSGFNLGDYDVPSGYNSDSSYLGSGNIADSASSADTSVAAGSREKRTVLSGKGDDTVTVMLYLCGTDLESKYGMASSDMQEIVNAGLSNKINVIVCTGGCSKWKTGGISNSVNQIYKIEKGGLKTLEADFGNRSMTSPENLTQFIKYCSKKYPASRNELIMWDHGGGSVSGYGYDEKNKQSGSMDLSGISQALKNSGTVFDFVGFDACLMATAETALMLEPYADYMIASEESEPGIGWYYTNWLKKLDQNTSMPTVEIGKNIIDDFVTACDRQCKGQQTTLSVIDLAEFSNTVPDKLKGFAQSVSGLISDKEYKTVSDARYAAREFAKSSKLDQVDLADLAEKIGTDEGKALSEAVKGAVKYNRTSSNVTNAYGLSIYFPYQRLSYVDKACKTYNAIGLDSEYSKCIRDFASLETGGQISAGGSSSPLSSLFGSLSGSTPESSDMIGSLLSGFLGGTGDRSIEGLDSADYMDDINISDSSDYIAENYFDASKLVWEEDGGKYKLSLSEEQWSLVHKLDMNLFYDDGEGYVDLGLDNIYAFDEEGRLVADTDRNWISINGQIAAYYHTDTVENGDNYSITGYVPALIDGEREDLILVFDTENPMGYIAGAAPVYKEGETELAPKNITEIAEGAAIDFICDYYSYDGEYSDSYILGDSITYKKDDMKIRNSDVGEGRVKICYCFTDIYNQTYWTEAIDH